MPIELSAGVSSSMVATGVLGALATALTASAHCAVMCGPLGCVAAAPGAGRVKTAAAWHVGRLVAYSTVGLACGLVGSALTHSLREVEQYLPWVMALGLVATTFELGKHAPALPLVGALTRRVTRASSSLKPVHRAALLGSVTPLLPCGLLYGAFLTSAATGDALGGALVLGAFGLGGVPALAAAQWSAGFSSRWPRGRRVLRVAVPLCAAAVLVWRAVLAAQAGGPACD